METSDAIGSVNERLIGGTVKDGFIKNKAYCKYKHNTCHLYFPHSTYVIIV